MATFTVTTLDDENDLGATETTPGGLGLSLREALALANANPDEDTIVFASAGTLTLINGQLVIASNVIIDGDSDGDGISDITIDAAGASRVLLVLSNTSTLDALVLTGGNDATVGGGGVLVAAGDLTIVNSTIAGNHGLDGGGIHNSGTLTLTNSSIEGNDAYDDGGGLRNSGTGVATLTNVTLSGNYAITGDGGGISNSNDLTLVNVTLSGNFGDFGGGLFNGASGSAAASVLNSTVSGNAAGTGGGIYSDAINDLTLTNSIVLGNEVTGADPDLHGIDTYAGVNIVGLGGDNDPDGNVMNAAALTDVFDAVAINGIGVTAGVLADNGGAVDTIAIKIGGTAHDAGDVAALPVDTQDLDGDGVSGLEDLPVDARGAARVFGVDLDIGAFEAGQFIVTTLDDEDYDLGSLTDETLDGDGLSLREALALANADVDANSILFDSSLASTGVLFLDDTLGELVIASDVTIDGDIAGDFDIEIDADGGSRVFNVISDTSTLRHLIVTGGYADGADGGGIRVAAGANLTLADVAVVDNDADGEGGGIWNEGTLTLTNAFVADNEAGGGGGGIWNDGTLTLTDTLVAHNYAAGGGGIATYAGSTATLINTTLLDNYVDDVDGLGGGILGYAGAALTLVNSTLYGNSAYAAGGIGSIFSDVTLINSTLSGNYAGEFGGGIATTGGTLTLTNSIVAGNASDTAPELSVGTPPSLIGGNIIGDERSLDGLVQQSELALTDIFAQVGFNPYTYASFGRLADNSGPVPTIGIKLDGPAHNTGDGAAAVYDDDGNPLTPDVPILTDARGFDRVAGSEIDLGAVELQPGADFIVDTDQDEEFDGGTLLDESNDGGGLSLREALALAAADPLSHDTITFTEALDGGTLTLTQGELVVEGNVTIDGNSDNDAAVITIDGDGASAVLHAYSGVVALNGLTITNGLALYGAGISVGSYLNGTYADVTVTNSTVRNNIAFYGGGISVDTGSSLRLVSSSVYGNEADIGGGIAAAVDSTLTVINSTVSGNHVENGLNGYGGGIAVNAGVHATLLNSTISGNYGLYGGGIYNSGHLTLINTTVANNSADYGGGLYNTIPICGCGGDATLISSTVSGNFAEIGGGIAVYDGTLNLTNSIVAGNGAAYANPDLDSVGTPNFFGTNILSQTLLGTPGGYVHEPNLANIFATVATFDPTPVDGDEFDAGVLANNGGLVKTVAIKLGGAAFNTGDNGELPPDTEDLNSNGNRTEDLPLDARGLPRISVGTVDVGAFEIQNSPPVQTTNAGLAVNEGASATFTAALLEYNDAQESAANVVYTITAAAAIGTLLLNGNTALGLGGTFTQADINAGHLSYSHDGSETTATSFGFQVSDGVNLPVTGQSFAIAINAVNDGPVNSVPGAQSLEANHGLAITGLSVTDPDAFGGLMSTTLSVDHGTLAAAALGGANVTGSGTDTVQITGSLAAINATLAGGNVVYTPTTDWFDDDTLTMVTNDGGHSGIGGPLTDTDTVAIDLHTHLFGTPDNDSFVLDLLPAGDIRIDALGGFGDTLTFDFRLVDATVRYVGNTIVIDGPSRHLVVTGFEKYEFTDGTVDNNDGIRLIDDLFYYSKYHDVWNAHVDADAHFVSFGRDEGRDPNAFFSTVVYRSANPDVAGAGVNPLDHFDATGWLEGRVPSIHFDPAQYLAANPDVAAAGVNPLRHYLQFGYQEGRQPFAPTELIGANGFDFVYYLNHNPDVAAANIDAFAHFMATGWTEGRNPNALFDVNGYLATYADVDAANVNPLTHYNQFGWQEGRDPSVGFDTTSYLAAYADVAAAHVNPLTHFLQFGIHEGRSPFADGVWG